MKMSRYFAAGFAALITLGAMLFAPMTASASDGTFYQNGAWPSQRSVMDYGAAIQDTNAVINPFIMAFDDVIASPDLYRREDVNLFDITALRRLNWTATDMVKRSLQHGLKRSMVIDRSVIAQA